MSIYLRYSVAPMVWLIGVILCACLLSDAMLLVSGDSIRLDKLISKLTQILLVIGIFPLKKWLQLSWTDFGFTARRQFLPQLAQGLTLALMTLLPVLVVLYALDIQQFDYGQQWTFGKFAQKFGLGLLLALLIAFFEETLFRGLLLTILRKHLPIAAAIAVSAFYYAILHFLKSKTLVAYADISAFTGFQLALEALGNLFNPQIFDALPALFVVGVFLALIRSQIPNSLGLCIGCHCGWVWQIKLCKDLFNVNPHADYLYLVSSYDGVIGPLIAVWLSVALIIFYLVQRTRSLPSY